MRRDIKNFINHYSDFIRNEEASVFIGAGISRGSGFVNWKELLTDIVEELGLDIKKERDLIEIAQYYKNENNSRELLDRKLIKEFTKGAKSNKVHKLLSAMEIKDYWTTNYDTLLEDQLKHDGYMVNTKKNIEDLTKKAIKIDKTVYKMHGDISSPAKAILLKDDYETYSDKWAAYSIAFKNALIQKTFLFLGFSFDDPNLNYLLSRIKLLLSEDARTHYCIMKKISLEDCGNDQKIYDYELVKQKLKIDDLLKRYKINVILIDEFKEINDILDRINRTVKYNRVFISGAVEDYYNFSQIETEKFAFDLSKKLIVGNSQITSGFGLGIGSSVINAGLEHVFANKKSIDNIIRMRPFPQNIQNKEQREMLWSNYRKEMLKEVGIAIFMFGNKKENGSVVLSDGMMEEFEIGHEYGVKIIPLPFTGYVGEKIYNIVIKNMSDYYPDLYENEKFIEKFKSLSDVKKLDERSIDLIYDIVKYIQRSSSV